MDILTRILGLGCKNIHQLLVLIIIHLKLTFLSVVEWSPQLGDSWFSQYFLSQKPWLKKLPPAMQHQTPVEMGRCWVCSMWSPSPTLRVELPMDTMEHATLHQNVQPRVELLLEHVPLALESVVSSVYPVAAPALRIIPMPSSLLTPHPQVHFNNDSVLMSCCQILIHASTHSAKLTPMFASWG